MKRVVLLGLLLPLLAACRPEGAQPAPDTAPPGAPDAAATPPPADAPVELKDVVETGPHYIVGITYPPEANKYPGLALELKRYADAARGELMEAVAGIDEAAPSSVMYDLALEFKTLLDTPQVFAIAADGGSFTGGAHGAPLIARFVWLPPQQRRLTSEILIPDPRAWREVSAFTREQLHAALSQRVDADELDPVERERVMRSAGKMIDEGSEPDAENFAEFEPVAGAGGKLIALRFVFPPYQVGPYSDGVQTVDVPASLLLRHVAPEFRPLFEGG